MAQAIIGAVSKMALMFATMLPPPAAAEAPLLALLRHNDLQYIASHLLVLPFLFDPDLKPLLGASLWFGTEAMQLRTAARGAYNDLVSEGTVCGVVAAGAVPGRSSQQHALPSAALTPTARC